MRQGGTGVAQHADTGAATNACSIGGVGGLSRRIFRAADCMVSSHSQSVAEASLRRVRWQCVAYDGVRTSLRRRLDAVRPQRERCCSRIVLQAVGGRLSRR